MRENSVEKVSKEEGESSTDTGLNNKKGGSGGNGGCFTLHALPAARRSGLDKARWTARDNSCYVPSMSMHLPS